MSLRIRYYIQAWFTYWKPHLIREKLQEMELFKDTHLVKQELLSNATTIDSALNYIRSKQQEQQHKKLALDSTTSSDNSGNGDDGQLTTQTGGRQTVF
jgi:hypothetical protein